MQSKIHNINVVSKTILPTPAEILKELPVSAELEAAVLQHRQTIKNILDGTDPRLVVVVGPCSIHDIDAAHEYAAKLVKLADEVSETIFVVMRVYFEKPRTTVGWKGLVNDPDMDDSFHVEKGIRLARQLMLDLTSMGLPCATEALDPIMPQYLGDLITWTAIGARTTESQTHREMSSGLSTPVGFKNGTDGSLDVAINALKSASQGHHFLGINTDGRTAVFQTAGNAYGHVVLRGGGGKPNYDAASIADCEAALEKGKLLSRIMVDCSHANSNKDHNLQVSVAKNCVGQIVNGNSSIMGLMLESNLSAGNQPMKASRADLTYGVSVTDACIDWKNTEACLRESNASLKPILSGRD